MTSITAIGFDLFNTLITVDPPALAEAMARLILELNQHGVAPEPKRFTVTYREVAQQFLEKAKQDGIETHNRFWISAALAKMGFHVPPDDPRISQGVEAYFSIFLPHCRLVPHTLEMLTAVKRRYPLGLLSNFTHGPAARVIINGMGLTPFFDVVLISGELGYRKPHRQVFERLVRSLGTDPHQVLYVGDDPEADIMGARRAGLRSAWMTHVQDHGVKVATASAAPPALFPAEEVPRISLWQDLHDLLSAKG
jgi:putative hydrolase of the HAD superfamily